MMVVLSRKVTSSREMAYQYISIEKKSTGRRAMIATFAAAPNAKLVLPQPGRAATIRRRSSTSRSASPPTSWPTAPWCRYGLAPGSSS